VGNLDDVMSLLTSPPRMARGWQERVFPPQPAAGASMTMAVPGDVWWRILSTHVKLLTSAVVANRFLDWRVIDPDGNALLVVPVSAGIAAATTFRMSLAQGIPTLALNPSGTNAGGLYDLLIPPGWSVSWNLVAADAADQLSELWMITQKFPSDSAYIGPG